MVDFEKLETAINNLDDSSKNILKLQSIVHDIGNIIAESEKMQNKLDSLTGIINDSIAKNTVLNELGKKTFKELEDYCLQSKEMNSKFVSQVNTLLLEMRNENTALYKTFESVIVSKFDMFKSDVMVENRKITDNIIEKIGSYIQWSNENTIKNVSDKTEEIGLSIEKKLDKKTGIIIALASGALVVSLISLIFQVLG